MPHLLTNQAYVEDVSNGHALDPDDKLSVFGFVLSSLPQRVHVYPTENYFYFSFHNGGIRYAGNLRFDALDRDKGILHFVYFKDYTHWFSEEGGHIHALSASDGVKLEKAGRLTYRVSYKGRSVLFLLNDLSDVRLPSGLLDDGEIYLGPIFDESAYQFFLVYNPKIKIFHYILNETAPVPDLLYTSSVSESILIGTRSGFAFYRDRLRPRKILIGVHQSNGNVNNYLDGPFDQLPDNFIEGDALKDAIIDANPHLEGKIDRYGSAPNRKTRHMISPYLYYKTEDELAVFEVCATDPRIPQALYHACFAIDEEK